MILGQAADRERSGIGLALGSVPEPVAGGIRFHEPNADRDPEANAIIGRRRTIQSGSTQPLDRMARSAAMPGCYRRRRHQEVRQQGGPTHWCVALTGT